MVSWRRLPGDNDQKSEMAIGERLQSGLDMAAARHRLGTTRVEPASRREIGGTRRSTGKFGALALTSPQDRHGRNQRLRIRMEWRIE